MPLIIRLDVMLAKRKVKSKELAAYVGISETSLSLFKSGRLKGIRFHNLEKMCEFLECQPGDILEYTPGPRSEDDGSGTEVPPSPE